jgi:ribosome-associated toxin RatA of RatAB toxin-antitoxin module
VAPTPSCWESNPQSCLRSNSGYCKTTSRYSPDQLYSVVADVEQYQRFVPWCVRSAVLRRRGSSYMEAEMEVGFQVLVER